MLDLPLSMSGDQRIGNTVNSAPSGGAVIVRQDNDNVVLAVHSNELHSRVLSQGSVDLLGR